MITYYDSIPAPPEYVQYKTLEDLKKNTIVASFFEDTYGSFLCQQHEIESIYRSFFDFDVTNRFTYQYIGPNLPVHKDVGRVETYNFIISPGGDEVKTVWFEEDKTTILYEEVIRSGVWHKIQVDKYHTVVNIQSPRILMSVFESAVTPPPEEQIK